MLNNNNDILNNNRNKNNFNYKGKNISLTFRGDNDTISKKNKYNYTNFFLANK